MTQFDFSVHPCREMPLIDPQDDHIIISVNEVGEEPYSIRENDACQATLRLHFDDCEEADRSVASWNGRQAQPMTDEQAHEIITFVQQNQNVALIVVHCAAGVSRSPAIAAALSYMFIGPGSEERFFKRHVPNRDVYRKLLQKGVDLNIWDPAER